MIAQLNMLLLLLLGGTYKSCVDRNNVEFTRLVPIIEVTALIRCNNIIYYYYSNRVNTQLLHNAVVC